MLVIYHPFLRFILLSPAAAVNYAQAAEAAELRDFLDLPMTLD
jgi:hypothetical protein